MYIYQENNGWNPLSLGLACFCILFFICSPFRSIESAHTSDEIYPISWVSRLSSAGIHVPIISTMRIMALRKLGGLQSEHSFSDSIQWEASIPSPLVLGVSVLHLTIMSPVSESWHMSSPVPATLWSLYPPYFSFCVARGTNVSGKDWYFSQSEVSVSNIRQWEGEECDLWDVSPLHPLLCEPQCCI